MWEEEDKAKKALYKTSKRGSKAAAEDEADEEMEDEEGEKFAQVKAKKH